jgi:hypothetical protein
MLVTLFIAMIAAGFAGTFRTPRVAGNPFEKRAAEPLPSLPDRRAAFREYPARFERFFDDRFGMRATLVHIDHWVTATVFGVSPVSKVLIGKSGWLYFRGEDSKAFDRWYRGGETVPDTTLIAARDELLRRQAFSRVAAFHLWSSSYLRNIRVPRVSPDWSTRIARRHHSIGSRRTSRVTRSWHSSMRGPLMDAKGRDRLYYQTDSHWNYLGATVGYKALMARVEQALPGLRAAPETRPLYVPGTDFYSGDLAQMLGLERQFRETDIAPLGKILATPESRCAKLDTAADAPNAETYVYRCPNAPRFTALVYRDSMGIPLVPMLAENFARTTIVTSAQLDPALVERLAPDIVIEEMVERTISGLPSFPMRR